jgi:hypothetical protein
MFMHRMIALAFLPLLVAATANAQQRIPAFTAYLDPDCNGAKVSSPAGITGWKDPALRIGWFGQLKTAGPIECSVALRLPAGATSTLRLTVAGQSRVAQVAGTGNEPVLAHFGTWTIREPGYQSFVLASLNPPGQPAGDIQSLVLDGQALQGAHFNLNPRRNAASVHLFYPAPKDAKVTAFSCEVTALKDPPASYYMACGWHRGYFGMQVNSPTERRIIFSVWDNGNEGVDRSKVAAADRVRLLDKGPGVVAGDFGHEGTGGHSHLVYAWKSGRPQRFLVAAQPTDATHTAYSGYYFQPEQKQWMLISSWLAPKEGGYLHGLYSFSENFGGANGHLQRKALYGNQWIRTHDGRWTELLTATFSHDPTGKADRLDRFMGIEDGQFFLSNGGFLAGYTEYGKAFQRPAVGRVPADLERLVRRALKP